MKKMISIGSFQCRLLRNGTFFVDGGAMFGVVPRVLWEKKVRPDPLNRVLLSMNPLLVLGPDQKILVDPGIGKREARRFGEHYAIQHAGVLENELRDAGVTPEEIDIVINTHLHWDHSGANLRLRSNGSLEPAFPNARYLVQKGEWESACNPTEWTRASYLFQEEPLLMQRGQLELIHGEIEIFPGVRVIPTPGHTPFHQSVLVESGKEALFYLGDLVPTPSHLALPYITALDVEPERTLETKRRILTRARDKGWALAFCHEAEEAMLFLPPKELP